jgi:hypothetical protein
MNSVQNRSDARPAVIAPRRSRLGVVLAVAGFVVVAWWPAQPSSADCVAPTLSVAPSQGLPGTSVTISGKNWYLGCYDPTSPAATYQGAPPPRPDSDIHVTFSDGHTVFEIARVTPAGDGSFSFQAQVPDGAQPTNDGTFTADGTNGSPTASFAVGAKPTTTTRPTPTTQGSTAATTGAATATTAARSSGSSAASGASSVDFGASPTVPNASTASSVVFNPSTPLAQVSQSPIPTNVYPAVSTPPVTLGSSGHSRRNDMVWVFGFLLLGLASGVGYFIYQRNPQWRPRRF